jgi:hypothetical protein
MARHIDAITKSRKAKKDAASFVKKLKKNSVYGKTNMTDEKVAEAIITRLLSVERQTAQLVEKVARAEDGVHNILVKVNQLIKQPYRADEIRGIVKGVHELTKALNDIMVRTT